MNRDAKRLQKFDDEMIINETIYNKNLTLSDIFQGYDEIERQAEYDWGKPTGREI